MRSDTPGRRAELSKDRRGWCDWDGRVVADISGLRVLARLWIVRIIAAVNNIVKTDHVLVIGEVVHIQIILGVHLIAIGVEIGKWEEGFWRTNNLISKHVAESAVEHNVRAANRRRGKVAGIAVITSQRPIRGPRTLIGNGARRALRPQMAERRFSSGEQ